MGSIVNGDKSFGFKLKTNFTSVYQSKAYGFGVDLGTQGKIGNLGYGVLVNNVFSYRYWDTGQTYSARPTIIFSSSWTLDFSIHYYSTWKATAFLDLGIKNIKAIKTKKPAILLILGLSPRFKFINMLAFENLSFINLETKYIHTTYPIRTIVEKEKYSMIPKFNKN